MIEESDPERLADLSSPGLEVTAHRRVLLLTLDRPSARNALDAEVITGLDRCLRDAEGLGYRAAVLTGRGDRAFCAGLDLRAPVDPGGWQRSKEAFERIVRQQHSIPVVAAVNGAAVGGGFELVLACDLVVAAPDMTFSLPEIRLGILPAGGATLLGNRIPRGRALELLLTGEPMAAEEAVRLGLVGSIVPLGDVVSTALALATRLADGAPLATRAIVALARHAYQDGEERAWAQIDRASSALWSSRDATEGVLAFTEKRDPRWEGY